MGRTHRDSVGSALRRVVEDKQWSILQKAREGAPEHLVVIEGQPTLDLSAPCTVIGGRNGAGKSRLLRAIADEMDENSLLIDVHHLCEQALMILRSREDFHDMAEEFGAIGPDDSRLEDVRRVVGREYGAVEWFALELEPADETVAERFCWSGDQPLVPYFRVEYNGSFYAARDMGLGEFAVHFIFWILEQYRDAPDLVLLMDEPDAYLPPVGVSALLSRLLRLCRERGWSMVVSTHSEELIKQAIEHDSFLFLRAGTNGEIVGTHSRSEPGAADTLLARPPIRIVLFCEDETAYHLTRSLLEHVDRSLARSSTVLWRDGHGFLRSLHAALPRVPRAEILFAYLFDGDQRAALPPPSDAKWPTLPLPTDADPDTLFRGLVASSDQLANRLNVSAEELGRTLEALEGRDPHDWVNDLSAEFGRQRVLPALADLWCEENPDQVQEFGDALRTALISTG